MSGARERQTLVRLSVIAGSAATFAAAWLGILPVGTGEQVSQVSTEPALTERLATSTPPASTDATSSLGPAPRQTVGAATAQVPAPASGAGAEASGASQAATSPALPPQQTATASSGTTVVVPTTPAPAPPPVQRVITRRSRAS